ncbi:hypothetical protein [Streptomyces antimycoticus]|uniref:hypothetical protein n=1 Tax=Streptomyces antimycoticus TaxID=68175 RepID=UPI003868A99D|nr:hypothetical protein OG751_29015 [Streptomyces antimycoticus]
MSTTNTTAGQSPLEMIAADEQTLRRTGKAARKLLAQHADLPLRGARLKYDGEIHLKAPTADDVHVWAERLGTAVIKTTSDPGYGPVSHHTAAEVTLDDIRVRVWHCRLLYDAEAAAWRESEGRS